MEKSRFKRLMSNLSHHPSDPGFCSWHLTNYRKSGNPPFILPSALHSSKYTFEVSNSKLRICILRQTNKKIIGTLTLKGKSFMKSEEEKKLEITTNICFLLRFSWSSCPLKETGLWAKYWKSDFFLYYLPSPLPCIVWNVLLKLQANLNIIQSQNSTLCYYYKNCFVSAKSLFGTLCCFWLMRNLWMPWAQCIYIRSNLLKETYICPTKNTDHYPEL